MSDVAVTAGGGGSRRDSQQEPELDTVRLFGTLQVRVGGQVVLLRGRRRRLVAAILALHAGRTVPAHRLAQAFAEDGPVPAAATVHVQVHRLRRALLDAGGRDGLVRTTAGGYQLSVDPDGVDALRFRRLAADGRRAAERGRPQEAVRLLAPALRLWEGGDLLGADPGAASWPEVAALRAERVDAAEALAEAELARGRPDGAVSALRRLTPQHPEREGLPARLMVALYRSGRQVEALEVYAAHRAWSVTHRGLEPGPWLHDLQQAVLRQDPGLLSGPVGGVGDRWPHPARTRPAPSAERSGPGDRRSPAPAAATPATATPESDPDPPGPESASLVLDTLERAAATVARAGGHRAAAEYLRLVVACRPEDDRRRPYALLRLGQAVYDDSGAGAVEATSAFSSLSAAGDRLGAAEAHLVLARIAWTRGEGKASRDALDAGLALLAGVPRRHWPLRLAATAVGLLAAGGRPETARVLADEVLAAHRSAGPDPAQDWDRARLLANRGLAGIARGDAAGLRDLAGSIALHRKAGGWAPVAALATFADGAAKLGRLDTAHDALREALAVAERQGSARDARSVRAELAWCTYWSGDADAAADEVRRWLADADQSLYLSGYVHCLDARIHLDAGDRDGARQAAARALADADRSRMSDLSVVAPVVTAAVRASEAPVDGATARLVHAALRVGPSFLPAYAGACLPAAMRACGVPPSALTRFAASPWRDAAAEELRAPGAGAELYRRLGSRPDALANGWADPLPDGMPVGSGR